MVTIDTAYSPSPHVALATVAGSPVLVSLGVSNVRPQPDMVRLNLSALAVWQRLDGERPLRFVIDDVARAHGRDGDEIRDGVVSLVSDLIQLGFLVTMSSG